MQSIARAAERRQDREDTGGVPITNATRPETIEALADGSLPALGAVEQLKSEADYVALASRFAIRRTDDRFWSHSDALHAAYRRSSSVEAGLFDYNRYENR